MNADIKIFFQDDHINIKKWPRFDSGLKMKCGCTFSSNTKINIFQILGHYCLKIINNSYLFIIIIISTDLSIEIQEDVQTRPIS